MAVAIVALTVCGLWAATAEASAGAEVGAGDGGWTWQNPLPFGNHVHDLWFSDVNDACFTSPSDGWAITDTTIYATTDGGTSWTWKGCEPDTQLTSIAFTAGSAGWVSAVESNRGMLLATTDGGATWSASSLGDAPDIVDVACSDPEHVWVDTQTWNAATSRWEAAVRRSDDGGASWQTCDVSGYGRVGKLDFVDATHGWMITDDSLLATTDGGASWGVGLNVGGLTALDFADSQNGWAGGGSLIARTTNGGVSWDQNLPRIDGTVCSLSFTDADHGFVGQDGGQIAYTSDGGSSWDEESVSYPPTRRSCLCGRRSPRSPPRAP